MRIDAVAVALVVLVLAMSASLAAQEKPKRKAAPFVPADFIVPEKLETERFRLRMLSVADVDKDFEAVVSSTKLLRGMFKSEWPRDGFTREENLADLQMHQTEFQKREAFAYTVVALDESKVLGCVYINPDKDGKADAHVTMWVRQSEYEKGLDPVLSETVKKWIRTRWPFKKVVYPGRK